jgi:hypothetical protein
MLSIEWMVVVHPGRWWTINQMRIGQSLLLIRAYSDIKRFWYYLKWRYKNNDFLKYIVWSCCFWWYKWLGDDGWVSISTSTHDLQLFLVLIIRLSMQLDCIRVKFLVLKPVEKLLNMNWRAQGYDFYKKGKTFPFRDTTKPNKQIRKDLPNRAK